jgi:hypothetical protein
MKKIIIVLAIFALILAGCQEEGQKVAISAPFIGGTAGISFDFSQLREEVYDGGTDPFDIVLQIENKGEADIQKDHMRITLSGINPTEFSKTEAQLATTPTEDIIAMKKDAMGNIQAGPPIFVTFSDLNHAGQITGTQIDFPIRANMCYLYNTKTISKICVRKNILASQAGGICEINEDKPVFNSGAPIQITRLTESARAKDK